MHSLRMLPRAASSSARTFSSSAPRSLARMQLIGRLADTPEVQATSTGRDIVRYAIGVSTGRRDEEGNRATSWFNIASFAEGPQRDLLCSLPKGTQIYVEAEAKMDMYEQDGKNRTSLNLLQRNFEALARPRSQEDGTTGVESNTNAVEEPQSGVGAS